MNELILHNYNLHWTLMGGQSFAWDYNPEGNEYIGFTQDKAIIIKVVSETKINNELDETKILWQTYPEQNDFDFLKNYLRLDEDYSSILKIINKDDHIRNAIKKYPNLRLLNQDFEQCLLSFILSSTKNIPAIRDSIRRLNRKFGQKLTIEDRDFFLFPKIERIYQAEISDLLECKIGFRAKYLKNATEKFIYHDLKGRINTHSGSEKETRETLTTIHGVGDKIADCVMVFSLKFNNITPLDIWGKRIFTEFYSLDPKMKYSEMRSWSDTYFSGYAAWAGQFLYEYIRHGCS